MHPRERGTWSSAPEASDSVHAIGRVAVGLQLGMRFVHMLHQHRGECALALRVLEAGAFAGWYRTTPDLGPDAVRFIGAVQQRTA